MAERFTYYTVALALDGTWKNHVYTYAYAGKLASGQVVHAPFGKKERLGYIIGQVAKPDFAVKEVKPVNDLRIGQKSRRFVDWLTAYYPGTPGIHVQHVLPAFLAHKLPDRKTPKAGKVVPLPPLTGVQVKAVKSLDLKKNTVLHGITGSGKTRVYLELIQKQFAAGKDVLLLYPEISLTAQLEKTLRSYLPVGSVHVYHSKRTRTQQYDTWLETLHSRGGNVFIGPRSALFLPHENLGLIIVDEAHDSAYKQDSGSHYNGLVAAAALAKTHGAFLIAGSATPPVQETQQILEKGGQLVCMHELATNLVEEPTVFEIVNMLEKSNALAGMHLLSKPLVNRIRMSLEQHKQALLFLNRRGTARMLLCENCGWHAVCDRCDSPMTYHHDSFTLQCHICGRRREASAGCPDCGQPLTQKSPGVKALEQELGSLFPSARIARFDSDNLKKESFSERYEDIVAGKVDIIVGTQIVTKGLDLPLLDTVGILQAESALLLPDYTSEERAFQQLTQVSGRVGRGHVAGHVILQTYQPDNPLFAQVAAQDWHSFYEEELLRRRQGGFPPHSFLMKLWVSKPTQKAAQTAMTRLAERLKPLKNIQLLGPAPSFYEKNNDKYAWQLVLKASSRKQLVEVVGLLPKEALYDLDPVSLL